MAFRNRFFLCALLLLVTLVQAQAHYLRRSSPGRLLRRDVLGNETDETSMNCTDPDPAVCENHHQEEDVEDWDFWGFYSLLLFRAQTINVAAACVLLAIFIGYLIPFKGRKLGPIPELLFTCTIFDVMNSVSVLGISKLDGTEAPSVCQVLMVFQIWSVLSSTFSVGCISYILHRVMLRQSAPGLSWKHRLCFNLGSIFAGLIIALVPLGGNMYENNGGCWFAGTDFKKQIRWEVLTYWAWILGTVVYSAIVIFLVILDLYQNVRQLTEKRVASSQKSAKSGKSDKCETEDNEFREAQRAVANAQKLNGIRKHWKLISIGIRISLLPLILLFTQIPNAAVEMYYFTHETDTENNTFYALAEWNAVTQVQGLLNCLAFLFFDNNLKKQRNWVQRVIFGWRPATYDGGSSSGPLKARPVKQSLSVAPRISERPKATSIDDV
ncbi:uncharacterized protein SPPG_05004 [Spizellomyces punctatus DAOM BR117]|uniref:G-protein coupled receptors family 2 profile 2 domain-containing protein n=1 Tax=Spizellomyces punctatus (strain DAOM BR117) TaxID=645134 RepID=A0A0L0HFR6_SPIPD|nr:hypothetical protein, variant [Spizellomyces punctatus DAOM BR117]XP_016607658.1 uncharacterized protein SPPG_05004 [Spizellomyces punctatus DAOM BR117]KNC99617.1 hypothetical protein, variant [Spizellomyces punctatus DAOM BR117]KNC99618.1 hypothetical protein SPPG_05004 [Spizellomyces punctatus DAOM BR117]|eukprot:XP_016607657.1 hypothetical protein, variant [Spizellomyces punctatus DAOM BR117]